MVGGQVHVQAARWVVVIGRVTTALFLWGAVGAALVAWASWSPLPLVPALLYAALAAGWHALLTAFDRHGRRAWAALVVLSGAGAVVGLGGWLLGADVGVLGVVGGLLDAVLVWALMHRDSREWVARPVVRRAAEPVG
ncbi:hypothetical protein O2W14_02805 [Modestobacter sp. VKM Ac-2986]|uniref:hypothetical protein n=1 Tax=Modestobacter sp. VKM Ac-2986 TaxID=3004140 RepID=UPI0022AB4C85|nr:hypothetical protein [Modestobacter sp. VKM Ac-2986]MCZ2827766.1 hypothetical protein [Modestobacter sp. VKM Ac-2986]